MKDNHMEEKDVLEQINNIINKKWYEMDKEDSKGKLKETVMELDALGDFDKEYSHFVEAINGKEDIPEDEADSIMESLFEKWTFIFTSIMNLDINNPFILSYMYETLLDIEDELYLEDE